MTGSMLLTFCVAWAAPLALASTLYRIELTGKRIDLRLARAEGSDPPARSVTCGLCTRIRDSAFKRSLVELPVGAEVDVEQPKGKFVLPEDASRPLVFVAGGIGITAFRSMLRYIQDERLPHRVTLIYSNRDRESTAFLDELEQIEQTNPNIRLIVTMTNDPRRSIANAHPCRAHGTGSVIAGEALKAL
jgi:ferredoxin-NADP reductase